MRHAASLEGRERARLFCGLRLRGETLDAVCRWQDAQIDHGRAVPREHLHVTLAFLGHRPVAELESILTALRETSAVADQIRFMPERYRETRSVGMLALTDIGGAAGRLAADLQGRLQRLGIYEPESRPWLAHLTVVRFRERPRLQPRLPDLGEFSPSDAAAYHSLLRPNGAQYLVVESFALGG